MLCTGIIRITKGGSVETAKYKNEINLKDLTIEEFTTPCPITVDQLTSVDEIMKIFKENGIRHMPVVSDNRAVGVISERDLMPFNSVIDFGRKFTAYDIIKFQTPYSVQEKTPIEDVAFDMSIKKIGSAVVENEKGRVTGIITTTDMLNALVEIMRAK